MKRLGIRHRILLAALAPATLVAMLVTGMLISEHLHQASLAQHQRLFALARQLAALAEHALFVGNHEGLLRLIEPALSEPDVKAVAILDRHGKVVAATLPPNQLPGAGDRLEPWPSDALDEPALHWHSLDIRPTPLAEADLFADTADQADALLGRLLLKVSNQSLHDKARHFAWKAAGIAALLLLLGLLLALGLARGLIRTLDAISHVVQGIRHGQHQLRVGALASAQHGELGELAQGIDAMAAAVAQTQEALTRRIEEATATLRAERDAAERASRSRSRFFAAASHDLRQPVQALGLFIEQLQRDARGNVLSAKIEQVARTVRTLQGLLDTLLDYSRLDGQAYRVERQPVNAGAAIEAVLDEFASLANERRLVLRRRIQDCWLDTDPALFHRIMLNLVGNALRHTQQGRVLVACRRRGDQARIEVWDTGPGIPPEHQQAIFEELVQLNNPERDPNKGLGLGLAIVRRSADLLGHPVEVRSRPGHGSCFAVTIPLATPSPPLASLPHRHE
ncbi:MAG: ATP-binding protein, partial [Rhodocyclaceae bacterium]|nr:ATP-binding protein [Rhodocyclaceae bacterium]